MNHIAHGELGDLATDGSRDVGDLHDPPGHVVRRRGGADAPANLLAQGIVQGGTFPQAHEQHDAGVVLPVLRYHEALHYVRQLLYLPVDLRRADPDATRVERGVAAAIDDDPVVLGERSPVAMAPYVVEHPEVRLMIARAVRVIPEPYRHAGKRTSAAELAGLATTGASRRSLAVAAQDLHRHAEPAGLKLTSPDRRDRIAQRKARDDVGPTADAGQVHILLHVAVDVVVAVFGQRTAGGQDGAQRTHIVASRRREPFLLCQRQVLGTGAKNRHAFGGRHVPELRLPGTERRTIIQHHGGAQGKR